jgi:hypothetical protein
VSIFYFVTSSFLIALIAITLIDFHPHWHINRPPPGFKYTPPPLLILDPASRFLRCTQEAERRAHIQANNRLQIVQTGRILSQFKQRQGALRHCSACTEYGHDKQTCGGCRSTGCWKEPTRISTPGARTSGL